jgi:hypothetical protein
MPSCTDGHYAFTSLGVTKQELRVGLALEVFQIL